MPETPGYFRASDGTPLYGVYHAPETHSQSAIVITPPLFEERKSAYAALAQLARALCEHGHPVLRFDYRGSGESGGAPAVRRWVNVSADLASACTALKQQCGAERIALLGLRLGATLALQEAAELHAAKVVALAPVVKGAAQVRLWKMRSKIRAELTSPAHAQNSGLSTQDSALLDFDGFEVAQAFFDDVAALDLLTLGALPCPSLLLQLSHREEPAAESEALAKALGPACQVSALRMEPFWDRIDEVDTQPMMEAVTRFVHGA